MKRITILLSALVFGLNAYGQSIDELGYFQETIQEAGSNPKDFFKINDQVYFFAQTGLQELSLMSYTNGSLEIIEENFGGNASDAKIPVIEGYAYFTLYNDGFYNLYKTDGSKGGLTKIDGVESVDALAIHEYVGNKIIYRTKEGSFIYDTQSEEVSSADWDSYFNGVIGDDIFRMNKITSTPDTFSVYRVNPEGDTIHLEGTCPGNGGYNIQPIFFGFEKIPIS